MAKRQHHKGKKRPGGWHQGPAAAKAARPWMEKIERAEERAADDQAQIVAAAREHRETTADWQDCLAQLDRAAPHVPAWSFPL